MKLGVERREVLTASVDVAVVGLFLQAERESDPPRALARENEASGGAIAAACARHEVKGKRGEVTTFHRPDQRGRILLVGLGSPEQYTTEVARRAAAAVVKALKGRGARTLGFRLATFVAEGVGSEEAVRALVDGAGLGGWEFTRYRSSADEGVEEASIFLGDDHAREEAALRRAVEQETTIVESVVWTREIANLPADTATPERLADEARRLGKETGLKVTVFDEAKLKELGCGGLLAVGGGSAHPPRLVLLEHAGGARGGRTVAVVGKGITFDSGGISIKPSAALHQMKFDKSGAVAVLGILRAAALLKVPCRVIGALACAENVLGPAGYRPGDVVRSYNGKTIEILNTDAEGRVVLSDALGYVSEKYHPDEVIDLATLTGAQVIALGDDTAALVANDDKLAEQLLAASRATGEPLWRMPLTDYHRDLVKSDIADVRNSSEIRVAGLLQAAAFLETFVGKGSWAHLDIAGPAYTTLTTKKWQPAYQYLGATGFGVRVVSRYLLGTGRSA